MTEPILRLERLHKSFGGIVVTDNVTLDITPGEIHAIIGPNGAGKSTLINQISGLLAPDAGGILFDGQDVTGLRPERRAAQGIVMVPEGRRLYGSLSVQENLQLGATYARPGPSVWRFPPTASCPRCRYSRIRAASWSVAAAL